MSKSTAETTKPKGPERQAAPPRSAQAAARSVHTKPEAKSDSKDDLKSLEQHAAFVNHQDKVEKIAVLAQHEWQHWLDGAVRMFLHSGSLVV